MKRKIGFGLTPLLLALVLLLCSCNVPGLKEEDGRYTNNKTGVTYLEAPGCYRAASYMPDGAVARIKNKKVDDVVLYAISEKVAANQMLSTEDFRLFYAEGVTLPTLEEMDPTRILIGETQAITAVYSIISNSAEVDAVVDICLNGASFSMGQVLWIAMSYDAYELRFESSKHEGIYYFLEYYDCTEAVEIQVEIDSPVGFESEYPSAEYEIEEYNDRYYVTYRFGKGVIVDRVAGKCYPAGTLIESYL